ncbi:LysR family transcriptional regulator [Massilia sp. Root418]|jgi:DNA-binding transcriptional LysR family regulator|uniref:LysR substrate-binding domain-containing protein n=1 Tax=Massilia sp. Root418 TaxID=1736532 RepID=UPI0006FDABEF|nr:LysR substrate-binding domain-containing protein [Massilia sp. Root418]KQW87807.1 LysR family transcriptional regulator [Massilia sp. Root418]
MRNLNDYFYFVLVVDQGGFAQAARHSGLPKSTLSTRLAALEAELGVRLIQRTSRRFTVTELGQEFYRHASAMLIEAQAAEDVVKGRLAEPSGAVRITASVPTVQTMLGEVLVELAVAHPRVQVSVHVTDRAVDLVQEGFDMAVRDHFAPLPDSGLVQRRVATECVLLVASAAYLAARAVPQVPQDLALHDGLMSTMHGGAWRLESDAGEQVEVRLAPRMHADESSVLLRAAEAGLGIACLPQRMVQASLEAGRVQRVLPGWRAGTVTTTLLMPHRRGQLPSVRLVADAIARAAQQK